ncbi:MAG: response regulator transcription factor [Actinomycetota bacterium]|nr:response regulator transcription factor [Actinomycetota bacterium]
MRVLLVEDEPRLGETVRRGLVAEGYVVEWASNGLDGLRMGSDGQFDVIVLDIMLPRLNGYDVLRRLREREVWTPVLMLTAKDGEYDQADAFDLGADDYLTKPFSFIVLIARLRALQRRGAPARPAVLTAGELALDPARRRVTVAGDELALTPREYGLLEFLLRHKDSAMTKAEILRGVWDAHYEGDDNVVEVYVGYLRRKLDAPLGRTRNEHSCIETVRGIGYRLRSNTP